MEKKYTAKYEETKEALIAFCEIFHQERSEMTILISIGIFGPLILILVLTAGGVGEGPGGMPFFLFKFLCVWAAAFFAGDIFAKTIGRAMMMSTARGDAEELAKLRIRKRKEAMVVKVEFYEDRIVNDTGTKQMEYSYSNVKKLLESDKAIGFLSDVGPGPKNFFGVPKEAFGDSDIEEVKAFLVEKCPQVKKFKKI